MLRLLSMVEIVVGLAIEGGFCLERVVFVCLTLDFIFSSTFFLLPFPFFFFFFSPIEWSKLLHFQLKNSFFLLSCSLGFSLSNFSFLFFFFFLEFFLHLFFFLLFISYLLSQITLIFSR